jgi:nitric oxide reductase large subunit
VLDGAALFGEIARLNRIKFMDSQTSSTAPRRIVWESVVTVISAAILIGAEVFGAAFAGGWALAILFGLDDTGAHIVQAVLFAAGVFVMIAFIRAASRVEPFTTRA